MFTVKYVHALKIRPETGELERFPSIEWFETERLHQQRGVEPDEQGIGGYSILHSVASPGRDNGWCIHLKDPGAHVYLMNSEGVTIEHFRGPWAKEPGTAAPGPSVEPAIADPEPEYHGLAAPAIQAVMSNGVPLPADLDIVSQPAGR